MNLKEKALPLGSLEFKAEDFKNTEWYLENNMYLEAFVDLANQLLRERLEKALRVESCGTGEWSDASLGLRGATHTARLVCIEPVGEKEEEDK